MIVNEIVTQELANKRLWICAYAMVSADNEDMMHPLSAQVSHIVSEISNKMIIENMNKLQSQKEYTKKVWGIAKALWKSKCRIWKNPRWEVA